MRTNPDDLAADLAELDQRYMAQQKRVRELELQTAVAKEVLDSLYRLKCGMENLAEMRRTLARIEQDAEESVKRAEDVPF